MTRGDAQGALAEMCTAYSLSTNPILTDPIYDVATAIKALDGHAHRANEYLLFQKFGPAGPDAIHDTRDDLENPLDGMVMTMPPDHMAALEAEIAKCGQDHAGYRRKSLLLLACGRNEKGLETMLRTYAISPMDTASMRNAIMDVACAIRAVDGNIFRSNQYLLYQKYGPSGPDEKEGTADDPKNPLLE